MTEDILIALENTYDVIIKRSFNNIDRDFSIDVYWFQIILKNLVENALVHGEGEVSVTLDTDQNYLFLEVSDEGQVTRSLNDLTTEFSKGNKSSGSGLGLSIILRVIKDWSGRLELQKSPTKFIVKLPLNINSEEINGKDTTS